MTTTRVIGVDGCKAGWIAIVLRDGRFETSFFEPTFAGILERARDAAVAAVDIPIGSEPGGFRRVDLEARRFGGPRANSVFRMPPIHIFQAASYPAACAECRALTTKAPSKQAWELRTKIFEVASLAAKDERIIEVHPEVSFRALLDRPLEHGKKTWAGQHLRRSALERAGIAVPEDLGGAGGAAAPDDVLDAAVAAWSAHRHATGASQSLEPKVLDAGRAVTIWF